MTNTQTITGLTTEQVEYLTSTLALNGHRVAEDGTLSHAALAFLADLPEDADGHYDGQYVWIGGTEYAVTDA